MTPRVITLLGLLLVSALAQEAPKTDPAFEHPGFEKKIILAISHPGFESKKPEEHELHVKLDPDGNPLMYAMRVKSVFCSDEKCDVITLLMQWDHIGRFRDYQLPHGGKLTKYEHEPFSKEDYAKFERLMNNRGSLLADLDMKQIVVEQKDPKKNTKKGSKAPPKDVAGKGDTIQKVDAISGATPSYIHEEVVKGAAYTCYTMWHWAHGNTAKTIRTHTQNAGTAEWLSGLLASKSPEEVDFALEAMAERKLQDATSMARAMSAASTCSMEGFGILIGHIAAAHPKAKDRYAAYQELMDQVEAKRRVYLLEQLAKQKETPPLSFFEHVATKLPQVERFYELQLYFNLAEEHQAQSDPLFTAVSKMLKHDNFFFSRRAHSFLKGKKLPAEAQSALQTYEKKHAGRL